MGVYELELCDCGVCTCSSGGNFAAADEVSGSSVVSIGFARFLDFEIPTRAARLFDGFRVGLLCLGSEGG